MFVAENTLFFSATNITKFYELIEKANKQTEELQATINKLNNFYFELEFSVRTKYHSGEIEEASSNAIVIPTK